MLAHMDPSMCVISIDYGASRYFVKSIDFYWNFNLATVVSSFTDVLDEFQSRGSKCLTVIRRILVL